MDDKEQTVETKQSTQPWGAAQPALKDILGQAGQAYNLGLGDLSTRSNQQLLGQATGGLGDLFGGTGNLSNLAQTAHGDYLNNNPHLGEMFSALSGDVTDAVNSQLSASGRTGDPVHTSILAKELGKLGTQIYGQDYARERQNQLGASGQLGSFLSTAIGQTPGVYDFGNADLDSVWKNLARYSEIARGVGGMGGESTGTQPNTAPSGAQQGIGSMLALASLFA